MTPITDDMVELKGCPFCGGKARLLGGPMAQETYSVWCNKSHSISGTMDKAETVKRWNTRAALEGSVAVPGPSTELVQQCKELLEWSKTGLLNGGSGGAVREVAAAWEQKVGKHHALSVAESQIKDDAMREIVRIAGALPRQDRGGGS